MIKKSLFLLLLLWGAFGCMKKRCYECKDDSGNIKAKGCDKTADEITAYGASQGWKCEILPD